MRFKKRIIFGIYISITIVLGLLSRSSYIPQTSFIGTYTGDTLWALAVSLGFSLVLLGLRARSIFTISLLFSFAIEILQLYHAPWIDTLRSFKIGALVLGSGFLWSDLICYTVGVTIGTIFYLLHGSESTAPPIRKGELRTILPFFLAPFSDRRRGEIKTRSKKS